MSQFVTVQRNSQDGQRFLWGEDKAFRYLPIKTDRVADVSDAITFKVIAKSEVLHPKTNVFLGELIKWRRLVFILFPFIHWLVNYDHVDSGIFILSLLSAVFLFLGASWQADVLDHMKGYDPIVEYAQNLLGQGILTARSLYRLSWTAVVLAGLFALPIFLVRPALVFAALVTGALIYFLFFTNGRAYKKRGLFDFSLILLVGPIFSMSVQYALFGYITLNECIFGFIWGLLFLFSHSIQSFPKVVQLASEGREPWLFLRDFEKNKIYFPIFWFVILALYFIYESLCLRGVLATLDLIVILFFTFKWIKSLQNIKSPLSSEMKKVGEEGYQLIILFIFMWLVELIFAEIVKVVAKLI